MPTVITKTVIVGGGGDYSSLSAAESGEQAIRPDLVSNDEQLVFDCRTTGSADTTIVDINGYTTDATRNIIVTAENDAHDGKWNTNAYRIDTSQSSVILTMNDPFTVFRLLQINNTHTSGSGIQVGSFSSAWTLIDRCIVKTTGTNKTGTGINVTGTLSNHYIRNTLVYDFSGSGGRGFLINGAANTSKVFNCTVHNCETGYVAGSGRTPIIKNCLAKSCTTDFSGTWNAASDYNTDEDNTAPGSNSQTGAATFVDEGADDFHLTSSDTVAYNLGTDLSGDANNPVTIDVDGTSRPQGSAFDIGFDEVVSASQTGRITAVDAVATYTEKTGRITASDAVVTYSEKTGRITASDAVVTYSEKTGRTTAVDAEITYSEKTARMTAVDAEITWQPAAGRVVAVDAILTFSEKTARLTATDAVVTFSEKTGRIVATDAVVTWSPSGARVVAVDAVLTFSEKAARITAADGVVTWSPKTARITASDAVITWTPSTARIFAVDVVLTFSTSERIGRWPRIKSSLIPSPSVTLASTSGYKKRHGVD